MNDIHPHVCSSFYFAPFHSSLPHLSTRFHPFLSLAVFPSTHRNCLFFHPSPLFFSIPFSLSSVSFVVCSCLVHTKITSIGGERWDAKESFERRCSSIHSIYRFNERLLVYWDFGWERECMDGEIGEIGGGGVVLVRWLLLFPVREIKV